LDRGAEAIRVPSPILFGFNSDEFTPIGRDAAQEFVKVFKERSPISITVTGHTDQIGGDAFNMELSKKRAQKVANFLISSGIGAKITVIGKGRSEPRVISNSASYTQDEINQLNRRVEFDWK
jgi:outer membrane protein OmpA-like peptidoglycan-associated protein